MALYNGADALYGTGTYGSAQYGVVIPTYTATGVSATSSIGRYFRGVQGTGATGLTDSIIVEPFASGVAGTGAVGTVGFIASVRITLSSATMTGSATRPTVTGVLFNFEAVKTLYDRKRVVYIPARPTSAQRTVKVS